MKQYVSLIFIFNVLSHDAALLASASEDMKIDIGHVETTEKIAEIAVDSPTFTVSWHPSR